MLWPFRRRAVVASVWPEITFCKARLSPEQFAAATAWVHYGGECAIGGTERIWIFTLSDPGSRYLDRVFVYPPEPWNVMPSRVYYLRHSSFKYLSVKTYYYYVERFRWTCLQLAMLPPLALSDTGCTTIQTSLWPRPPRWRRVASASGS